jgi:hypothetical protein
MAPHSINEKKAPQISKPQRTMKFSKPDRSNVLRFVIHNDKDIFESTGLLREN